MTTGTRTSKFGSNGWVGHDSSEYYARGLDPLWYPTTDGQFPDQNNESGSRDKLRHAFYVQSSENMSQLKDASVHLMVTSPPYNVGKEYDAELTVEEHVALIRRILSETFRVLVPGGRACVNVANIGRKPYIPLHAYIIKSASEVGFHMRGEIIWVKPMAGASTAWGSWRSPTNPTLRDTHEYILVFQKPPFGRKRLPGREPTIDRGEFLEWTKSVWEIQPASSKRLRHPAPFPVELPWRLVRLYTFSDDVVLDPFMGTGSAAVAALRAGRRFVGYDINGEYVKTATERLKEEGLTEVYDEIANNSFNRINGELTDDALADYFRACFNETIRRFGLFPAWACVACISEGKTTASIGKKPRTCDVCRSASVYEIGNFQARGIRTGTAFRRAVDVLFRRRFNLDLSSFRWPPLKSGANAQMNTAIQVHGSPATVETPGGPSIDIDNPGMARGDTLKKARSDAQQFKDKRIFGKFYVLTNHTPDPEMAAGDDLIDRYVDVTILADVEEVAKELKLELRNHSPHT